MKSRNLLKDNEENARIISISIDDVELESTKDTQNIDFIVAHSGESNITKKILNINLLNQIKRPIFGSQD